MVLQKLGASNGACGGARRFTEPMQGWLRNDEQFENLRLSIHGTATFAVHEREHSILLNGPPESRSGTLGLKEGCIWSDSSGGVGIIRESKKTCPVVSDSSGGVGLVCGMKCGIFERTVPLRNASARVRSRNETLNRSATSCVFVNLECEPPKVCLPKFSKRLKFNSYRAHCTAHGSLSESQQLGEVIH